MKPLSFETLTADQIERIERSKLKPENNTVLHFIEDMNRNLN
mgnify:CR=1 FL=1